MSEATVTELMPIKKQPRTTKVETVVVNRKTITVQSRTALWAVGGVFVLGWVIGAYSPPEKPATAANAAVVTTMAPSISTVPTTLATGQAQGK